MKEKKLFNRTKAGLAITVAIMFAVLPMVFSGMMQTAKADETYFVTVKWNIPGDYTLEILKPAGTNQIYFTPADMNFTGEGADSQTAQVRAMNITNRGNIAINITANFTAAGLPTGVTMFNLSQSFASQMKWYWTNVNATIKAWEIEDSLAIDATAEYWAWSTGTEVAEGEATTYLRLVSAAA